ncbi:MAG: glycosyltransferase, partial [Erysipelotrichaceae bacterium]|nr:glycosyltransferase [Erysipelotrichaceae bacterium]
MKILIATDFYIHNLGGVTTSILALCAGLRSQGHEVKILTLSDRHESFRDGDEYYIRSFKAYYSPGVRFTVDFNDPLLKELEQWKPDIIHVHSEGTALTMAIRIAKHCDVPLVMTAHTDYAYFTFGKLKDLGLVKAFVTFVGGIAYKPAEKIVVPSQKALNFPFLSKFSDRLVVVPNGIEMDKYQKKLSEDEKLKMRKQLGIADEEKILVTVTRLSKEKNIEELIDYFPALLEKDPDIKLLIVGDGPDRKHLEKLTSKYHLDEKVIFVGRQSANDVWRYYDLADIFVSDSTFDVHSLSYLEALA